MKPADKQDQLKDLLQEARNYIDLQKEYLQLTVAQRLTHALSALAVAIVMAVVLLVAVVLLGLALVHWVGEAIGNLALCYAIFSLLLLLLLLLFYINRRRLITLPLARLMARLLLPENIDDDEDTDDAPQSPSKGM